jgi:hypothetical protein
VLSEGENWVEGVRVEVARKRLKRVNLRVGADGAVKLSVPLAGGARAMRRAEEFLREKWGWAMRMRAKMAEKPPQEAERTATGAEVASLWRLLRELNGEWCEKLGERGVTWRLSTMKSRWGVCNWKSRRIGYSTMLATKPRELVEYVVVHELTHLRVHGHGAEFWSLVEERLPEWRELRARLKG